MQLASRRRPALPSATVGTCSVTVAGILESATRVFQCARTRGRESLLRAVMPSLVVGLAGGPVVVRLPP